MRVGDGGFFAAGGSPSIDLGLYFGSADVPLEVRGRSDVARDSVVLGV